MTEEQEQALKETRHCAVTLGMKKTSVEQLTGKVPCHARCEVTDELLRLLDVPKSLAAGQPVWWQDEKVFSTHTME